MTFDEEASTTAGMPGGRTRRSPTPGECGFLCQAPSPDAMYSGIASAWFGSWGDSGHILRAGDDGDKILAAR
jgi:hypothetical protein